MRISSFRILLVLILSAFGVKAQVSSLPFTQSIDTFQFISGTVVDAPNVDDIFYANLPIGFPFTYNGVVTNKFGVCTNGFIVMDSLSHSSMWTLGGNSTKQVNVLLADLQNTNANGRIEYVTVGTAPNRVCIIQFRDYGIFANPFCHLNAQIRLHEGSNCIQFYYGYNALSGNMGKIFFVGLTGATTSDYQFRTTNNNWINSSPSLSYPGLGMLMSPLSNLPNGLVMSFGSCPASGIPFSYITGNVYQDNNNNGLRDAGENGLANVLIQENNQAIYTTTDTAGNYAMFFIDSMQTYQLSAVAPLYWNVSSTPLTYSVTPISQPTVNRHFGLHATPNVHDVAIHSTSSVVPWPNATVTIFATYRNQGTVVEPGDSIFLLKDSMYSFVSANPAPAYVSGDSLVWIYSNLLMNEQRNISVQVHADTTLTIGDTLHSYWTIKPITGDTNTSNNHVALHQPVVNSYDPNSKEVSPDGNITGNEELVYTIHFQNMGTAPAINVFVRDTLDVNLDIPTFRLLGSSHAMTYTLNGPGRLLFTFAGIYLPDSNTNEPASHGFVQYAIKPKGGLSMNTSIENTASIYFDFNPPIVTNTTQNIIVEAIPNGVGYINSLGSGIQVYPNPTNGVLMIGLRDVTRSVQFTLYDVQGRVVMQQTLAGQAKQVLDISALNQGVYFIDLVQGQQRFQGKLIKQ